MTDEMEAEIRELVGALDGESTVDAVRDLAAEWKHYSKEMNHVGYVLIPQLRERLAAAEARVKRGEHELRQERERSASLARRHAKLLASLPSYASSRFEMEKQLDALLWVWCSGGCSTGILRWVRDAPLRWQDRRTELTEEIVAIAEQNTRRLRSWFEAHRARARREDR